jgi:hypothetical protein
MIYGTRWLSIGDDGEKRAIGKAWYIYVREGNMPSVKVGKKDSAGQWYIKEDE